MCGGREVGGSYQMWSTHLIGELRHSATDISSAELVHRYPLVAAEETTEQLQS